MTKEELRRIIQLDRLIQSHLNELEKLKGYKYQLSAVSYDSTRVQTSAIADPTGEIASRIVDRLQELMDQINEEIDALVEMKKAAEIEINAVEDMGCRVLLTLRYLEGLTWEKIAERLGYSVQHVYRLHGTALLKILRQ